MSDTLTEDDIRELVAMGRSISLGLSCDVNGEGLPCLGDRLGVLPFMVRYLRIHGYEVTT